MKRLKRYILMMRILIVTGGYKRAEFLKKIKYFKSQGEHCYLQPWNYGTEPHMITLGDNVYVTSGVKFINHDVSVFMLRYMEYNKKFRARIGEIVIGNNVFIGADSIILYDVHIGNNVIIGAGSIVTSDIPDNVVAAGTPCRPIGHFDNWKKKMEIQ